MTNLCLHVKLQCCSCCPMHYHCLNQSPGMRFSKDPKTSQARKAALETMIPLPWKAALLICFRYREMQNNCQVSKLETCSYLKCKGIYATQNVLGRSRNGSQVRQEEGLLDQAHFSLQLFFSKFQLLCIQWGSRRIALGALVNQNRFQGSCWAGVFVGRNRRPLYTAVFLVQPIYNCCLDYLFCFWCWLVGRWLTHVVTSSACHPSACFSVAFWSF